MDKRILLIEDDTFNLELMTTLLECQGYRPLTAENGTAGLVMVKLHQPDLILCDIQMAGMDGYELAHQIKADPLLGKIPLVAVSALAMEGDRERGLAAGFDGYISKPIDSRTFASQVEAFFPPGHKAILIIDDLNANSAVLRSILEPSGYTVFTADSMTDAMALARRHLPDLILSDVQMHEGNGYQLCEAIKTDGRLKHIPVILITSIHGDEASRRKGLALGAVRYLFRPIDSSALLAEITASLSGRK